MNQNILREQTKVAKAMNDEFSYKDFALALDISQNSFYNWLSGAYDLSETKYKQLQGIIHNLL